MNVGTVLVGGGANLLPGVAGAAPGAVGGAAVPATAGGSRSPLAGVLAGLRGASAAVYAERLGSALGAFVKKLGAPGTAATASSSGGALAFLRDARLSVEEKLARLMVHLSGKYERQLEQKLRQYADLDAGKGTPSRGTGATTGLLQAATAGLSSLLSKVGLGSAGGSGVSKLVGQVAGPVLAGAATALGAPALAPVLLRAGPLLGSVAAGITGGAAATAASGTGATADTSEKQIMTEIQILQEKQKEMFTLVSGILRSMHDTKMAVLSNIR